MRLIWSSRSWSEYRDWQDEDGSIVSKINTLIDDTMRSPFRGLGKPEPLKGDKAGFWSRRITDEHRLVYRVSGSGSDQALEIAQCRNHY